jgi:hypothetical protein
MEDLEGIAWKNADLEDLWIFDKLIVSKKLRYTCGPAGVDVPIPGNYIVRPCVNIPGMSKGAEIRYIERDTHDLPSGHFWCEIFKGRHISVDYLNGKQVLAVEGFREERDPLYRFNRWQKINDVISIPKLFQHLKITYEKINIEYIDGRAIEVHLRHNPDFVHGNSIAYPVWKNEPVLIDTKRLRYIEAPDFHREGFWID